MADPVIRFERVKKAFGSRAVLEDVSFDIPRSRAFCLLGRSGTGKSVTLKHVIGLLQPDAGRVTVEGRDMATLSGPALVDARRRIGFLFQHAALFDSLTVGGNVAFPLHRHRRLPADEIERIARSKLEQVGLRQEYHRKPAELSGGMRKRVGLARAMALDPPVLLVDEPSAGLDPVTAGEIDRLLLDLKRRGVTLLMVTHNIPSARAIGDELALLDGGRIVARGSVAALDGSPHPLVRAFLHAETTG
jgi:phospholipid/cholesterol/gamma-HCH transport system ATP-binding protein